MAFLIASAIFFVYFYRWVKKPLDSTRIRFVASDGTVQSLMQNGNIQHESAPLQNKNSLILDIKEDMTVLIVYSHDSKAHLDSVLALAEFLRDVFNMNVKASLKYIF